MILSIGYKNNGRPGFTLIELLIIIAIIGTIVAITLVSFGSSKNRATDATRKAEAEVLENAVETYIESVGSAPVPSTWANFASAISQYVSGTVPTGTASYPYFYCRDSVDNEKYLLGALFQDDGEIIGDIDGLQSGYANSECIYSFGSSSASPNCNDNNQGGFGGLVGTVLCLGLNNP